MEFEMTNPIDGIEDSTAYEVLHFIAVATEPPIPLLAVDDDPIPSPEKLAAQVVGFYGWGTSW